MAALTCIGRGRHPDGVGALVGDLRVPDRRLLAFAADADGEGADLAFCRIVVEAQLGKIDDDAAVRRGGQDVLDRQRHELAAPGSQGSIPGLAARMAT